MFIQLGSLKVFHPCDMDPIKVLTSVLSAIDNSQLFFINTSSSIPFYFKSASVQPSLKKIMINPLWIVTKQPIKLTEGIKFELINVIIIQKQNSIRWLRCSVQRHKFPNHHWVGFRKTMWLSYRLKTTCFKLILVSFRFFIIKAMIKPLLANKAFRYSFNLIF